MKHEITDVVGAFPIVETVARVLLHREQTVDAQRRRLPLTCISSFALQLHLGHRSSLVSLAKPAESI